MCSAAVNQTELRLNVSYRLQSGPIRTYPFEHFLIEKVFDPETSRRIRKYWPSSECFESIANTKRVSPGSYKQRKIISLETLAFSAAKDVHGAEFWKGFYGALGGEAFMAEMINWLWPSIKALRQLPEKINLTSEIVLTDDDVGYALSPHTDAPSRLLTLLFFVPLDGESEFAGTSLYVRKDSRIEGKISAVHQPRDEFDRVFTAPFMPDSALGFVVGPASYHGVEPLKALPSSRRQIQYCIRWAEA